MTVFVLTRDVVGMTFDFGGDPQQRPPIEWLPEDRVGGHDASHDRGRARSKPAARRDRRSLGDVIRAERLLRGFRRGVCGDDEEVLVIRRHAGAVSVDRYRPCASRADLELSEERQGDGERVEAWAKIRA